MPRTISSTRCLKRVWLGRKHKRLPTCAGSRCCRKLGLEDHTFPAVASECVRRYPVRVNEQVGLGYKFEGQNYRLINLSKALHLGFRLLDLWYRLSNLYLEDRLMDFLNR